MDWLLTRQTRANIVRQLDRTNYVLMGISMLLFIIAGLRGAPD